MKPRPWDQSHPTNWNFDSPESRIDSLAERVTVLERVIREKFGPDALDPPPIPGSLPETNKRGPTPALSRDELFYRRESIIDFLEFYWPELSIAFKKRSVAAIRRLLEEFATSPKGPSYGPSATDLLSKIEQLCEFLSSKEWNGDPRLAASAMAGVPKIRWTTSLRHCRKIPTDRAIGRRALRDYLHRNFPTVFRSLLRATTNEFVKLAMASTRTTDREFNWLRDNPDDVLTVMRVGQPGQFR